MKNIQSLNGTWTLRKSGDPDAITARVPGCVHLDLMHAGKIDDPYYRDNENRLQWIGEADWEYSRDFYVPPAMLANDRIVLQCEGLDTLAAIHINGQPVAATDNMFRTWEFDVKDILQEGSNQISITFQSPLPLLAARQKERRLPTWVFPGANYIRKEQCNFGWDWGPRLITCGIWRAISLVAWSAARLDDVQIMQDHASGHGNVVLGIIASTERAAAGQNFSILAEVSFDGAPVGGVCAALDDDGCAAVNLSIAEPRLWWPAGMGEQPLYTVRVTLFDGDNHVLDHWERRIGLRELKLRREKDEWGESFQFEVNGEPFFAKGANWIPADTFAPVFGRGKYRRLLRDAAAANMNMLRVWGGGLYEQDEFYDLCDELGLCVWQDFMFACATYPTFDAAFMESVEAEFRDNIRRLRHHSCIALWCGNNELEQGLVADEWTERAMSWTDYVSLFDDLLPQLVDELDPQRPYWPCSPHTPDGDRRNFNDPTCGDAHLWDVWHGRKPFEWYWGCRHRFVSEFGFQSFPHPRLIEKFTAPDDRNVTSYIMEHHQRCLTGNAVIMTYMLDWMRMPKDFESTVWASQILQGLAMQMLVEQLRRNQPQSMGALYWQLNDCWPVASWSSIDYSGRWKALHWMARRFFAPMLLSGVIEAGGARMHLFTSSDVPETREAKIKWGFIDLDGKSLHEEAFTLGIPGRRGFHAAEIEPEKRIRGRGARDVIFWSELIVNGRLESECWMTLAKPKHMELARDPGLAMECGVGEDGESQLIITTKKPAMFVFLDSSLPGLRFIDNFFHLRPGRSRVIKVSAASALSLDKLKSGIVMRNLVDLYE